MGCTGKYSIYDYLENLDALGKRSSVKDILGIAVFVLAVLYTFVNVGWGLALIFIVLLYNLTTYFKSKSEIDPYITSFRYIFRILHEIESIKKCKHPVIQKEVERLSALYHKFDRFLQL